MQFSDRATKEATNRLINQFVEQGKIAGALCHGVSILAWARVNGRSLLAGKRVVAPTRAGPAETAVTAVESGHTVASNRFLVRRSIGTLSTLFKLLMEELGSWQRNPTATRSSMA